MKSTQQINSFFNSQNTTASRVAIFLSGTGTNAEKILAYREKIPHPPFAVVALVTDRPQTSRANDLAKTYHLPVIASDIAAFYHDYGLTRVSLATVEGCRVRELWTATLREQLAPLAIDFAIFAGFVPLTNLTADFPCLNIHPGDLTYLKNGQRHLIGLHTIPIERALLEGLDHLRSTVILAEPYGQNPAHMDSGLILGISDKVEIDWQGHSVTELTAAAASRPSARPVNGHGDVLEQLARANQNRLKELGDWIVFPRVVEDFSLGKFGRDNDNRLYYRDEDNNWQAIHHVIYGREKRVVQS